MRARWGQTAFVVTIIGAGVVLWAALLGTGGFDSDEAIFGLIARRALLGDLAPFMYGQRYIGTIEAMLGAVPMRLFGGAVEALRLGVVALYAGFLVLHVALVRRSWGGKAAFFGLAMLVVPPISMLPLVARPVGAFSALLFFGTSASLLASWRPTSLRAERARLVLLGAALGAGLWSHPLMLVYIAALVVAWLPGTQGWRLVYRRLESFGKRLPGGKHALLAALVIGSALVASAALFGRACGQQTFLGVAHRAARVALAISVFVALIVTARVVASSGQRRSTTISALALAAGFVAGWSPGWVSWIATGVAPTTALVPSCLDDVPTRAGLVVRWILPAALGIEPAHLRGAGAWVATAVIASVFTSVAVAFVVRYRRALWAAFVLRPREPGLDPVVLWTVLLITPVALAVLGANTVDVLSSRYLVITWQAGAVLVGVTLSRLSAASAGAVALTTSMAIGFGTLPPIADGWRDDAGRFSPRAVAELETFMAGRGLAGGYADYRNAYALDFLIGNDVALSPYAGAVRHHLLADRADRLERVVVVVDAGKIPSTGRNAAALRAAILPDSPSGLGRAGAIRSVIERVPVGSWDVWVVERARQER